jgi:hypothetical protein
MLLAVVGGIKMFTAKLAIVTLIAASATVAAASPSRLTDTQFIEANRCLGLMESKGLNTPEAGAMKAFVSAQSRGRVSEAWDRGDEARLDARIAGDHPSDYVRGQLTSERDGLCESLLPSTQTSAATSVRRAE